jgi:hypothetical protein
MTLWQAAARGEGTGLAGGRVVCAAADHDSDAAIATARSRIPNETIVIGLTGSYVKQYSIHTPAPRAATTRLARRLRLIG